MRYNVLFIILFFVGCTAESPAESPHLVSVYGKYHVDILKTNQSWGCWKPGELLINVSDKTSIWYYESGNSTHLGDLVGKKVVVIGEMKSTIITHYLEVKEIIEVP
jgi:hypothetical protein